MSDQGTQLTRLTDDFMDTVVALKRVTAVGSSFELLGSSFQVKMITGFADLIGLPVEEGYFDTLGKKEYISNDERFQSWELVRLVAKRGNDLVTQIVKQAKKSPVREQWVYCQQTLEKITDSIVCALSFRESYVYMIANYRSNSSPELEQVYGSPQSFHDFTGKVADIYIAHVETAKRLAVEMFTRVGEPVSRRDREMIEREKLISESNKIRVQHRGRGRGKSYR
jgi:hypothetical protein